MKEMKGGACVSNTSKEGAASFRNITNLSCLG